MKKIITIFDGRNFSEGIFEFIKWQNATSPVLLTGVFLNAIDYATAWNYPMFLSGYLNTVVEDFDTIAANVQKFKNLCERNGIEYRVHEDIGTGVMELIRKETRFSDLLVMSGDFFYNDTFYIDPDSYLKDTLHESECPVLLLPDNFKAPVNNILAYDGSPASVYAIKQFSALFPAWRGNKTHIVYASTKGKEIPDRIYIEELAVRHFPNLIIDALQMDARKYFNTWLIDQQRSILVTGAYGRSSLSESLKNSFVSEIVMEHKIPVFVAHRH
ncbi:MAG: hypothetical protein JST70_02100 [Bacteroidetes bacterium]|nr:hypothetical protein [Bacteroidota bacterium]